jgi:hypothetical protein
MSPIQTLPSILRSSIRVFWTRFGALLATVNLVAWGIVVAAAPPNYVPASAFHPDFNPVPETTQFTVVTCWDCGRFLILGRELGSYWNPLPVHLLVTTNLPPLMLTSSAVPPYGQLLVQPIAFVAAMVVWWLLVGAFGNVLRARWSTHRASVKAGASAHNIR